jgi:hypothetical protein
MVLDVKMRLVLAGAVLGASLLALKTTNAQVGPTTSPPTSLPGTPQTTPGIPQTTIPEPVPLEPLSDAGLGGSGPMAPPSVPSPFGGDAGFGGSGFSPPPSLSPPSTLGGADAGSGFGY